MENAADLAIANTVSFSIHEGDVLPCVGPDHLPSVRLHLCHKICPGYRALFRCLNAGRALRKITSPSGLQKLPEIPVSGTHLTALHDASICMVPLLHNAQAVLLTQLITDLLHCLQILLRGVKLMPIRIGDAVDDEMIMKMFFINVCDNKDLMIRPQLFCKGGSQHMRLFRRDLPRRK